MNRMEFQYMVNEFMDKYIKQSPSNNGNVYLSPSAKYIDNLIINRE